MDKPTTSEQQLADERAKVKTLVDALREFENEYPHVTTLLAKVKEGQMSEQPQEWTVTRLASYIDCHGRLDDKRLLADLNAELAVHRQAVLDARR
jgi:hypothetical protein